MLFHAMDQSDLHMLLSSLKCVTPHIEPVKTTNKGQEPITKAPHIAHSPCCAVIQYDIGKVQVTGHGRQISRVHDARTPSAAGQCCQDCNVSIVL